jgi:hypothetical protein
MYHCNKIQPSLPKHKPHNHNKSHWVTSLQDKKDGTVYVLDSYSKTFTLTPFLEIQLSVIYGQGKTNLLIKLPGGGGVAVCMFFCLIVS